MVALLDVSESLLEARQELCEVLDDVVDDLVNAGIDPLVTLYGLNQPITGPCATIASQNGRINTGNLLNIATEGDSPCYVLPGGDDESWGVGSAIACRDHDFRANVDVRVILPMFDEAPCVGIPCDNSDRNSITRAINTINNLPFSCSVNPLRIEGDRIFDQQCIDEEADRLAAATGGVRFNIGEDGDNGEDDDDGGREALTAHILSLATAACQAAPTTAPTMTPTSLPPITTPPTPAPVATPTMAPTTQPPTTDAPTAAPTTPPETPNLVCAEGEGCSCDDEEAVEEAEAQALAHCGLKCLEYYGEHGCDPAEMVTDYECELTYSEKCVDESICPSGYYYKAYADCVCSCAACDCVIVED